MVIHNTLFWNSGRGVIFAPVVASVYNPFAAVTLLVSVTAAKFKVIGIGMFSQLWCVRESIYK